MTCLRVGRLALRGGSLAGDTTKDSASRRSACLPPERLLGCDGCPRGRLAGQCPLILKGSPSSRRRTRRRRGQQMPPAAASENQWITETVSPRLLLWRGGALRRITRESVGCVSVRHIHAGERAAERPAGTTADRPSFTWMSRLGCWTGSRVCTRHRCLSAGSRFAPPRGHLLRRTIRKCQPDLLHAPKRQARIPVKACQPDYLDPRPFVLRQRALVCASAVLPLILDHFIYFPKIDRMAFLARLVSAGSEWPEASRFPRSRLPRPGSRWCRNLAHSSLGRVSSGLLQRHLEEKARIAFERLGQGGHTIERNLVGALLEHGQDVGITESRLGGDLCL